MPPLCPFVSELIAGGVSDPFQCADDNETTALRLATFDAGLNITLG
jgi:hypothetical protein